jgi:alpha-tubulin suppressor-like RCC1 family protein
MYPSYVNVDKLDGDIVSVAAGSYHMLVATANGKVYSCGDNSFGRCGRLSNEGTDACFGENWKLREVTDKLSSCQIQQVATTRNTSYALAADREEVWSFGDGSHGELGRTLPQELRSPGGAVEQMFTNVPGKFHCLVWCL